MQGLLDFIKTPEGQGLLSAAFGGLAGARRGEPINSMGKAGLAGIMGYGSALDRQERTNENAMQNKLRQMQIAEAEQKAKDAEAQRLFFSNPSNLTISPASQALAGGEGPTAENAAKMPALAPKFDVRTMYNSLLNSGNPALAKMGIEGLSKQKDDQLYTVGGNLVDASGAIRFAAPKEAEKTPIEKALDAAGITDPIQRRKYLTAAVHKSATHPSTDSGPKLPMNYRWGPPDEDGNPTVVPLKGSAVHAEAEKSRNKNISYEKEKVEIDGIIDRMIDRVTKNPRSTAGPLAGLARGFETIAGVVDPTRDAGPAIDQQQDRDLIIGFTRELVRQNRLTNMQQERIENALGGKSMSTPANALSSLNAVKRMARDPNITYDDAIAAGKQGAAPPPPPGAILDRK